MPYDPLRFPRGDPLCGGAESQKAVGGHFREICVKGSGHEYCEGRRGSTEAGRPEEGCGCPVCGYPGVYASFGIPAAGKGGGDPKPLPGADNESCI